MPERLWLTWKVTRPGEELGVAFDGLVALGERFVFFPKPWRAFDVAGESAIAGPGPSDRETVHLRRT